MTENKDEINSQLINLINEDFDRVYKNLYFASKQIIKKGFSNYPIFIMTKENTLFKVFLVRGKVRASYQKGKYSLLG